MSKNIPKTVFKSDMLTWLIKLLRICAKDSVWNKKDQERVYLCRACNEAKFMPRVS